MASDLETERRAASSRPTSLRKRVLETTRSQSSENCSALTFSLSKKSRASFSFSRLAKMEARSDQARLAVVAATKLGRSTRGARTEGATK